MILLPVWVSLLLVVSHSLETSGVLQLIQLLIIIDKVGMLIELVSACVAATEHRSARSVKLILHIVI